MTFFYFKLCSMTLILLSIAFFFPQVISFLTIGTTQLFSYESVLLWCGLYFWFRVLSLSNKYSNFWLLNKLGLVKRVLIPAQYKNMLDQSFISGCWTNASLYTFIAANKIDSTQHEYWKISNDKKNKTSTSMNKFLWQCIKVINATIALPGWCNFIRFNLLQILMLVSLIFTLVVVFVECDRDTVFYECYESYARGLAITIAFSICTTITSSFGKYAFVLIDLPIWILIYSLVIYVGSIPHLLA